MKSKADVDSANNQSTGNTISESTAVPITTNPPSELSFIDDGPEELLATYITHTAENTPKDNALVTPVSEPEQQCPIADGLPQEMNILFLGETGVGKSTFINGMINYLSYRNMDEAIQGGAKVLIESFISVTDMNYTEHNITVPATIANGHNSRNEALRPGQSCTLHPRAYSFQYGDKVLNIIDTPGVGDTKGAEVDKENMANILSFLTRYNEIHAICILLLPNNSRLNVSFKYCVNELLRQLHVSASQNIMFCFTNSRATLYRPGNTLGILRKHLKDLSTQRRINIELNRNTLFFFDNEAFRFLCAFQSNCEFSEDEIRSFAGSWDHSVNETYRLFEQIARLEPHRTKDSVSVNNTREMIRRLAEPLAKISQTLTVNIQLIEERQRQMAALDDDRQSLNGELYVDQVVISVMKVENPKTVCISDACVKFAYSADEQTVLHSIPKTCHDRCVVRNIKDCATFDSRGFFWWRRLTCRVCECDIKMHRTIHYEIIQATKQIKLESVASKVNDNIRETVNVTQRLRKLKEMVKKNKADRLKISEANAEFVAYLKEYQLIEYNDAYADYLDLIIRDEEMKSEIDRNQDMVRRMKRLKEEYINEVESLRIKLANQTRRPRSTEEIEAIIAEIKRMPDFSELLKDIENVESNAERHSTRHQTLYVQVRNFFARM